MTTAEERPEDLLTPLAYNLSLAPPRAPPLDSAHRALLVGQDPSKKGHHLKNSHSHATHAISHYSVKMEKGQLEQHGWIWKLLHRAHVRRSEHSKHGQHPHLEAKIGRDAATRWLGSSLSIPTFNNLRDAGSFRAICDTLVLAGVPVMALASPRSAMQFLSLTNKVQHIEYGSHKMQFIDLYQCENPSNKEVLVFVHGGAWGSGLPWFYRLIASAFIKTTNVAIVGYRTYPDASVEGQVEDLNEVLLKLQQIYPNTQFSLMGHSSGAHIGLVHAVQQAKKLLQNKSSGPPPYHTFIGISGCYDIHHHYDYEAARGVEELSPMKAANGYSVKAFRDNSPAHQVQDLLLETEEPLQEVMPKHMLLLHGMEDSTVPFTSTSELGRRLKACGLSNVQEIYLAKTGHQETIMQVMTGGLTRDKIVEWMKEKHDAERPLVMGLHSRL
jgi:acetyl esterase/lipase